MFTLPHEKADIILLITDKKRFALDVQALARFRRRVSVVLIGEDSLAGNIGFTVFESSNNGVACGNAGACSLP